MFMHLLILSLVVYCTAFKTDFSLTSKVSTTKLYAGLKLSKYWRFETALLNPYRPTRRLQTRVGKSGVVEKVKALLEGTCMLMALPVMGVNTPSMLELKGSLPEGTVAKIVKNRLMAISINGTQFEAMIPYCKGENMYFFIPPDINQPTFAKIIAWVNEKSRKAGPVAVALEGQVFTGKEMYEIANLPPKIEYLNQFMGMLMESFKNVEKMLNIMTGKEPVAPVVEGQEPIFFTPQEGQNALETLLEFMKKKETVIPDYVKNMNNNGTTSLS